MGKMLLLTICMMSPTAFANGGLFLKPKKVEAPAPAPLTRSAAAPAAEPKAETPAPKVVPPAEIPKGPAAEFANISCESGKYTTDPAKVGIIAEKILGIQNVYAKSMIEIDPNNQTEAKKDGGHFTLDSSGPTLQFITKVKLGKPGELFRPTVSLTLPAKLCVGSDTQVRAIVDTSSVASHLEGKTQMRVTINAINSGRVQIKSADMGTEGVFAVQ